MTSQPDCYAVLRVKPAATPDPFVPSGCVRDTT